MSADAGILMPPRLRILAGCNCKHEDWEHGGNRQGCLIRGCVCKGWWSDLGPEVDSDD